MNQISKSWKYFHLALSLIIITACNSSVENTPAISGEIPNPAENQNTSCLEGLSYREAKVIDVIDGDTIIVLMDGMTETVRYLGVDAPEMKARNPEPGRKARTWNREQVGGKTVRLYVGSRDRDDFDRLLRLVIVDDLFVNSAMIREGLATSFNRPHDDICAPLFTGDMMFAYQNKLGIWQEVEDFVDLPEGSSCPDGCIFPPTGCGIKGNINYSDDYIYHLPGSGDYADVKIESERGEKWFCTIEEAISNGWRPPREE